MTFWSQNKCQRTLTFTIVDDQTEEVDERVNIVFGVNDGNFFASSTDADITIVDNDMAPNTDPRVTTTNITVNENTVLTAALERTDDEFENLTGLNWQLRTGDGDDDNDRFVLHTNGRLRFKGPPTFPDHGGAPDYENPDDSDQDRVYKIRVRTQTGTPARGARWSADADVTVTIRQRERAAGGGDEHPPGRCGPTTSLTMAWDAPTETDRPAVTGNTTCAVEVGPAWTSYPADNADLGGEHAEPTRSSG